MKETLNNLIFIRAVLRILSAVAILLFSQASFAVPAGITFQGRLLNNSVAVESASVTLTLKVTSPNVAQCVLYEETHTLNMTGSDGVFTVKIGGGVRTGNDAGLALTDVFSNRPTAINGLNCPGGGSSYTPGGSDSRNVYVTFVDGTDVVAFSAPYVIQSVPYALEAERLAGKTSTEFLQTNLNSTQSKLDGIFGPTNYTELLALLSGTSTQYLSSSSTNGTSLPVLAAPPSSPTAGRMWYEGGVLKYYDGSSSSIKTVSTSDGAVQIGATAGGDLSGAFPNPTLTTNSVTTAKINDLAVTAAKIANTTITDAQISSTASIVDTKLATISTAGKVSGSAITSGTLSGTTAVNTSGNIQTSGSITTKNFYLYDHAGVGPGSAGLQAPTAVTNYVLTLPPALPAGSNYVLASDTSGVLSWIAPSTGSVTSVTGTSPVVITGTATVPNVTVSAATTAASGVVTLAASGGTTASTVVQATDARLSDSRAPNGSASGDLSGTYPSPTVAKIQSTAVSSTTPTTSGQVLRYSGTQWAPSFISMFDLRSTITGASTFGSGTTGCTAGQTLTWTAATDNLACTTIAINDGQITNTVSRAANTFLASPNGSTGAATYRAIASEDLPSGVVTAGTYKSVTVDTYGRVVAGSSPTTLAGQGITDAVVNGGQAGAVAMGPSDANALTLNTGGSPRMTIAAGGNVGIGGTSPGAKLDIGAAGSVLGTMRLEGNTSGYVQIQPAAAAGSWTMTLPATAGTSGYVLSTDGSGVTSWVAQSAGGAGTVTSVTSANADIGIATTTTTPVLTLNSGTGASQIVKLDSSAKLPAVDGSALTSLDPTHLSAAVAINKGGTGQSTKTAGFDALSPLTTKGDLISTDGTNNVRLPAGTNGYVLQADSTQSSGLKWAAAAAGTVTSVTAGTGLNVGGVAGASVTSTGTLSVDAGTGASQIVQLTAAAKYPAVDGSLITNLNAGNISSGTLPVNLGGTAATSFAANAVVVSNGTGSALQALNCTSGQVITFDVSGYAVCGSASATGWVQGGNSFGAAATIGTNDAYSLAFKTNNAAQMTILSTGKVGIGTATPAYNLTISGTTYSTSMIAEQAGLRINSGSAGYGALNLHSPVGGAGRVAFASGSAGWAWDTYLVRTNANELTLSSDASTGAASLIVRGSASLAATSGSVGIGTTSPTARLDIAGNVSNAASVSGKYLNVQTGTATDSTTAASGTATSNNFNTFSASTLAATNTSVVTTDSATVRVTGAPIKGTNNTVTNAVALDVGSTAVGAQTNSYGLRVAAQTGATTNYAGVFTGGYVGIGTSTPVQALEVSGGNIKVSGSVTSGSTEMVVEQTGDTLGTTRLRLRNRNGANGAIFENAAVDLVDFGFQPSTGATSISNLRLEHRTANMANSSNTAGEFQFINTGSGSGTPWFSSGPNFSSFKTGKVGIGTTAPTALLDVNQTTAGSAALQSENAGAVFWKVLNPAGGATNTFNAANSVMYVGMDTGTSRSINAAGTINASGADFAEWIEWNGEKPQMGSVVRYRGSYVVVSSPFTAAFVGNDTKDPEHSVLVAFAGQLPVLVRGIVHEGDLIVAGDDGVAVAISKNASTLKDAYRAVGTAWASSNDAGIKRVHVAVGIGLAGGLRDVASLNARTDAIENENAQIKSENQKLKKESAELKVRLDKIEKMLNAK